MDDTMYADFVELADFQPEHAWDHVAGWWPFEAEALTLFAVLEYLSWLPLEKQQEVVRETLECPW